MNFLELMAEKLVKEHGNDLHDVMLVFPNKRSGLFFRKYLSQKISRVSFAPEILDLNDFIYSLSPLKESDQLTLVFSLHRCVSGYYKDQESLDKFFYWGELLLNDFEEIDQHLINAQQLFQNVRNLKELENKFFFLEENDIAIVKRFWEGFIPKSSPFQEHFLSIWNILGSVYDDFKSGLLDRQSGYKGMIYRLVAESCNKGISLPEKEIWFTGFNALTKAEKTIIKYCLINGNANIFWDVDGYYLDDEGQEAGDFLRIYKKDPVFQSSFPKVAPDKLNSDEKIVEAIGVPLEVGQAKHTGTYLKKLASENDWQPEKTVVVLSDEHLLFPLLNALPNEVTEINVTMGYPVKDTPVYSLIDSLIELQQSIKTTKDGEVVFYYKPVLDIISHPLVFSVNNNLNKKLLKEIHKNNKIYLFQSDFRDDAVLCTLIFSVLKKGEDIIDYLLGILHHVHIYNTNLHLDREYIYHLVKAHQRIKGLTKALNISLDLQTFKKLFHQISASLKIPFKGEPLKGLQIMGVLETRNLDFENVIILSMNENSFPKEQKSGSFIPYGIRKAFKLPTYEHQQSIYAYLFYRLLHNAKNIRVYYNTQSDFGLSGEISRFITQLDYESKVKVKYRSLSNNVKKLPAKPITIKKDNAVMKKLENYLKNGKKKFSPSALNTYIDCRLKFYFRYIACLYESEQTQEKLDPAMFGNILHCAMHLLYQDIVKRRDPKIIQPGDFARLRFSVDGAIQLAFNHFYDINKSKKIKLEGRNVILSEVLRQFIEKVIKHDEQYAPFEIQNLEGGAREGFKMNMPIHVNDRVLEVGLKGIIDRVDKKSGTVRIIDYKSGGDDKHFSDLDSLFDPKSKNRNKAVFQVFYYAMLYQEGFGSDYVLKPGIFNMTEIFTDNFSLGIKAGGKNLLEDARPYLGDFKKRIKVLLEEIYSADAIYDQTDDLVKCGYCPYNEICKKN